MTKVSQVAPLYNSDRQQDKAERREAVCNQVLDQIDTGFDQCMLMHGLHGFGMVGAGQNFNGHVVSGNGKDFLAGQPLRRAQLAPRLAGHVFVVVRHEEAAPTSINSNGVTRLQTNVDCVHCVFQVVAGHGSPRLQIGTAVVARGINADAPRDHGRGVFDAQVIKPEIANLIHSAAFSASSPV